ncbi:hypothetical protein FLK61_41125 [Paenalkalicoccus suaedae]|uniref:Uncharacterized protein n=1 Tax=Paenalkalicoccus suaedae TaxID=2592382 RepID=A0A859FJM9_9BACI|nr:hypothetical protein FLK61_41125 [Paenalkalicoccus suaedae]
MISYVLLASILLIPLILYLFLSRKVAATLTPSRLISWGLVISIVVPFLLFEVTTRIWLEFFLQSIFLFPALLLYASTIIAGISMVLTGIISHFINRSK